ncbi:MAG: hypothetical protein ACI30S_02645 [Muribaculaceae bacterium]
MRIELNFVVSGGGWETTPLAVCQVFDVDTIRRDSPSHEVGGMDVTRRRRYAPRLVLSMTACSPSLPIGAILA